MSALIQALDKWAMLSQLGQMMFTTQMLDFKTNLLMN
jgi:hypothetical protein